MHFNIFLCVAIQFYVYATICIIKRGNQLSISILLLFCFVVPGMTAKQVEEEIDSMRKEVLQFKQEFRRERDKLDRLSKEYEQSKKLTPPQRYTELKYMIKDAVNTK